MSVISSVIDAPVVPQAPSMSFRQAVAALMSRFRVRMSTPEGADMPKSDRCAMRQSDYEQVAQRWDGSPYREIRNQIDAFREHPRATLESQGGLPMTDTKTAAAFPLNREPALGETAPIAAERASGHLGPRRPRPDDAGRDQHRDPGASRARRGSWTRRRSGPS